MLRLNLHLKYALSKNLNLKISTPLILFKMFNDMKVIICFLCGFPISLRILFFENEINTILIYL